MLIEDKASGTQLIQDLIADGCYGVSLQLGSGLRAPSESCTSNGENEIHDTVTVQERDGIYSPRQIDYFNKRLQELGQPWVVSGDYVLKFRRRR